MCGRWGRGNTDMRRKATNLPRKRSKYTRGLQKVHGQGILPKQNHAWNLRFFARK